MKAFFFLKANYESVGCFASSSGCGWNDIFSEQGITPAQCTSTVASMPGGMTCWSGACISQMVYSVTSMTVEACLQICTTNGFKYAGLDT